VASTDDVLEFLCAGAWAVQVGTALFADPALMVRLVDEVRERLDAAQTTVADLIGCLHRADSAAVGGGAR
jgi:dihydroorotate dehydrogenase